MKPPTRNARSKSVSSLKHKDKRVNIPTEELRDFVETDEKKPKTVQYPGLLYARDPSLDPQLVWKGKDEQDQKPLEVPAVPVYIQEKIHPQAIVEQVRAEAQKGVPAQAELFADFNGIQFKEMVDFYRHEQNWSNRMILGDSLLVMTSLAEKEGLKGKVQMIYIDPPYGIKFGSNWQVSTRKRDVKDGKADDLTRQPEQVKAFRDTWELGIHSYLSYLRDRLVVARELLTESGSVFVQIGDENVHLVRSLMDEVIGSDNFVSLISFRTTSSLGGDYLGKSCDYLVWYGKARENMKYRQVYKSRGYEDDVGSRFTRVQLLDGERRPMTTEERSDTKLLSRGSGIYRHDNLTSQSGTDKSRYRVEHGGVEFTPGRGYWKTNQEGMSRLSKACRLAAPSPNSLSYVRFLDDFPLSVYSNVWTDTQTGAFTESKMYVVQTNDKVIERCILMTTDPGDLVLDPTCGSGTTAYVGEQWGRRWITIDTSRVALALARTRLMAAKFPYYILADSREGVEKEAEIAPHPVPLLGEERGKVWEGDIRRGFVYKRVPHVTLKSIANNEEIDAIHAKWQPQLELILDQLNVTLTPTLSRSRERGKKETGAMREWDVPREAPVDWPEKTKKLLAEWWRLRRELQKETDDSIARHADTELLYDQPYEDNRRVRVTGPFTVESISPHRMLSSDTERPSSEKAAQQELGATQFVNTVLENLKRSGVHNRVKGEQLKFERIESYAGLWIQATGDYTDKTGKSRRVAISIGPENGTVGPDQVKEAAKEAVQGVGFDVLVVCGFAFDPHVAEEATRYGKLTVLTPRMNYDLTMGDEVLKKTRGGDLFVIYGEPDVVIRRLPGPVRSDRKSAKSAKSAVKSKTGQIVVEIKGLDVYDPTTGQIRPSSTDDIACWFIDTDYNGESFFVRHAYFTGGQEPYDRLKRALRAEINEAAWSALYRTESLPFDPPKTSKIAVKVINHYGDEVLKVFKP